MSDPTFQIDSDSVVYTNSLTPVQVTAISSSEYSSNYYLWNFGDGTKSTGLTAEHVYESVGEYDITLSQYLSSGDIVESASQPITAVNLIPNLMDWDSSSYSSGSITASVKNSTPYIANVYNSWQQYGESTYLHLYVEHSKSIPFDITDKRIHLKPNWRFLDTDDTVIDTLPLVQTKLYAQKVDDSIYISDVNTTDSVFVGVSSTASFYFIDDTPSGIDPSSAYLPSTIVVSQNMSEVYGDTKFTSEDYLQYPALIKSVFVDNIVPDSLTITSNGAFDIDYLKFENTKIPYNIRIVDSAGNYIKTNPVESPSVSAYFMDIGFIGSIDIESTPALSGNTLERFVSDFSNLGGFYESYFTPTEATSQSVVLTASTMLDYTINEQLTRIGAFADENSNKIYRVSYVQDYSEEYTRKDSEVIGTVYDELVSNKFSMAIDTSYNTIYLDSDDSRIETYDTSFNLLTSIELSSYDEIITGHTSPAQICLDKAGSQLITLYDAAKLIYNKDNILSEFVLYPSISSSVEDDSVYQPSALELLSDDSTLYISYATSLSSNFIEKYSFDADTLTLSSLSTIDTYSITNVDMISSRDGTMLYSLGVDNEVLSSSLQQYDTSTHAVTSIDFDIQYGDAQYITLDIDQNVWIAFAEDNFIKVDTSTMTPTIYALSSYDTTPLAHGNYPIGGIAGDSYGNIWVIDTNNDRLLIMNKDNLSSYSEIIITEDTSSDTNNYVAYGDWNGFRWYNKFGYGGTIITYTLSGQSEPFIVQPRGKYNLQKINEDFDMTETLKSYRTTEAMSNYDNLFDNFFGSIYGNKYDDGTYIGRNIYEKIANFVMNHSDIDTCSIDALESLCGETGIEFSGGMLYPRDIKRIVELFSIRFKKLWGDDYKTGFIEDYVGDELDITTYVVSADPQTKIIAKEKFNNHYSIITPLIVDTDDTYSLSSYEQKWGWGLSVPTGGELSRYYNFYEMLPVPDQRIIDVIDWDNELTDTTVQPISSFQNYMSTTGLVSTALGDKLRQGLGLYL